MGHGASVSQAYREEVTVFVGRDLVLGCKRLVDNPSLRNAFLNFIKSGEWLDKIPRVQNEPNISKNKDPRFTLGHRSALQDYVTSDASRARFSVLETSISHTARASSPENRTSDTLTSKMDAIFDIKSDQLDSYFPVDKFCCFSQQELVSVMLGIVLPMFERCEDYQKYLKHGHDEDDASTTDGEISPPVKYTKSSRRAQDCLLSCAANCQESELAEHMGSPHWPDFIDSAFDNYHLPISVIDANQKHRPFLFVNKAFIHMFGGSRSRYISKSVDILSGPDTEPELSAIVQDALRTNASCKVALTHYTAGGKKVLDCMALRASGGYTLAVHCFGGDSPTLLADVKVRFNYFMCKFVEQKLMECLLLPVQMVDDVLLLMSYVIRAPPASKRKRGQSWIPNIGDLRGMSRRLQLLPDE
jgi:hypothetical protein